MGPLEEPIAGQFVMNTQAESRQAIEDYRLGRRTGRSVLLKNDSRGLLLLTLASLALESEARINFATTTLYKELLMRNIERATEGQASQLDLEQTLGFGVYDKENNHIGELTALWTDHTGQPAFIGVRTNWLFGKTHVVPAQGVEVNLADRRVRIPFYEGDVKEAPCFDPEEELDSTREEQVYAYYGMQGRAQPSISGSASEAPAEARGAEEVRIPLREEQVRVGKRSVDTGGVRLRKIVRTERINQPVELQKEEIVVERVPGREGAAATGEAFQEQEIYIPLRREEAVVEKETRVREEVLARKQTRTEQQTVSESVRKEDVETDDDTARGERSKAEALRREGQGEGSGPCGES